MHPSLRKQPAGVLDQKTFLLLSCCTSSSLWIKSSVDLPSLGSRISYLLQLCEGMWKSGCVQLNSPFSPDPAKKHQAQKQGQELSEMLCATLHLSFGAPQERMHQHSPADIRPHVSF